MNKPYRWRGEPRISRTDPEWSRYLFMNEEARDAYYRDRDTIDRRYKVLGKKEAIWYWREVAQQEPLRTS